LIVSEEKGLVRVPDAIGIACSFFLLYGILSFVGSFFLPRVVEILGYAAGSIVVIITAVLVLRNNRWASRFVFLCATIMTVDAGIDTHMFSSPKNMTVLLAVRLTLYWAAYLWYRSWRKEN